jgi:Mn-dependent DtxR family transcriptional regulator
VYSPDTVTEAISHLRSEGYLLDFLLVDGELRHEEACVSCRADEAVVEKLYRFEGPSDPGDEMIVLGLRDPATGQLGVLASAFGHAADPEVIEHITGLATRFPGR